MRLEIPRQYVSIGPRIAGKDVMSPTRSRPQAESAVRDHAATRENLTARYSGVRGASEMLCQPLAQDDYGLQAMPDTSPPKWHLAHTTWFFETFLLKPFVPGYRPFHPQFEYLFNSYYEQVGAQFPRPQRGLLSRPTVDEVYRYRAHVDAAMTALLVDAEQKLLKKASSFYLINSNRWTTE